MSRSGARDVIQAGFNALGISQKQFAERLGVDPATVNRWLKGTQLPGPNVIPLLAKTISVDAGELYRAVGIAQSEEIRSLRRENTDLMALTKELLAAIRDVKECVEALTVEVRRRGAK